MQPHTGKKGQIPLNKVYNIPRTSRGRLTHFRPTQGLYIATLPSRQNGGIVISQRLVLRIINNLLLTLSTSFDNQKPLGFSFSFWHFCRYVIIYLISGKKSSFLQSFRATTYLSLFGFRLISRRLYIPVLFCTHGFRINNRSGWKFKHRYVFYH